MEAEGASDMEAAGAAAAPPISYGTTGDEASSSSSPSDPQGPRHPRWGPIVLLCLAAVILTGAVTAVGSHRYGALIAEEVRRTATGLDLRNMDPASRPEIDFNLFANGNWMRANKIPDDHPQWGTFTQMQDDTLVRVHRLVERASALPFDPEQPTPAMKVGAFWRSAMSVGRIEAADVEPLTDLRAGMAQVAGARAYARALGRLHGLGLHQLFDVGPSPDPADSRRMMLWLDQGGLGLPDREYYFREEHLDVRLKYQQYVQTLLLLLGYGDDAAFEGCESILRIETLLAEASQRQEYRRNPVNLNRPHSLRMLRSLTGNAFDWDAYAAAAQLDLRKGTINVPNPGFLRTVGALLRNASLLPELKVYHDFHTVSALVPALPGRYVDALFDYHSTLTGQRTLSPRWKRMLRLSDALVGELVGELYCGAYFPPDSKARAAEVIANVRGALRDMLRTSPWMGARTRRQALQKLDRVTVKIGYPDRWINYTALAVDPAAPFVTTVLAARAFHARRLRAQVGRPVDRSLWYLTPQTVNAYYNPAANEIVFPAAVLQPPIFGPSFDLAVNYGAMGALAGHELTHGFDDMGRRYDADGNLRDWWRPSDARHFEARAAVVVAQYAGYTSYGKPLNGELTQGESLADIGGLKAAYRALHQALDGNYTIDGLTQDQRFFLSWAQMWRSLSREAATLQLIATDPHPPSEWRIKGPLATMPEFHAAFGVRAGHPMWRPPADRPAVW